MIEHLSYCSVCGKPLPTPLDEYGDAKAPICFTDFMNGQPVTETRRKQLEKKIEDLDGEIEDVEGGIEHLEDQLYELKRELSKAQAELNGTSKKPKADEKRRLEAWEKGLAKIAKDKDNDPHRTPLLQLN